MRREDWAATIHWKALASEVLAVAQTRIEGGWSAYCNAVPGIRHMDEVDEVLRRGDKLPEKIARAIFPYFDEVPYIE